MDTVLTWLLEDDMPQIQYRTMIELQGDRKDDIEIIKSFTMNMKCAKILLLKNLVSLGFHDHPWVKEQIQNCNRQASLKG